MVTTPFLVYQWVHHRNNRTFIPEWFSNNTMYFIRSKVSQRFSGTII